MKTRNPLPVILLDLPVILLDLRPARRLDLRPARLLDLRPARLLDLRPARLLDLPVILLNLRPARRLDLRPARLLDLRPAHLPVIPLDQNPAVQIRLPVIHVTKTQLIIQMQKVTLNSSVMTVSLAHNTTDWELVQSFPFLHVKG